MICCEKCFKDVEIKAIIKGIDSKGNCSTCGRTDTYIYNTDVNDELLVNFNGLLEIYTPLSDLPDDYPREKTSLLEDELNERWNIFNFSKEKIYTFIVSVCKEKFEETPELFTSPIGITSLSDRDYLLQHSVMKIHEWEDFIKAIKTVNRFHIEHINTDVLDVFCDYIKRPLRRGETFYRARISGNEEGYPLDEMGAPPTGIASDGRVNPSGISCLYLGSDIETTLHEIRAGTHDYIAIGEFKLIDDIEILDFTSLDKISPFSNLGLEQHAINKEHLRKISNEIAKPLRRSDGPLDYLPTQYIAEYIKSKGHCGIKYKSTMNPRGYNLAIFDENLFERVKVDVYDIKGIVYNHQMLEEL